MSASESHSALVLELAEEFLERYRQGQRPSLKEYIDRHPELAAEIKEVFPAMAMMENIALADDSLVDGANTVVSVTREAPPQQLGDYRILREVGRGGMGVVYEAEQVSLGRHVALKVLTRRLRLDDTHKRRFEREAKAAAKLHHTNIVPVFGVGEHDGLSYYVMQFIQGLGLDEVLEELKRLRGGEAITSPAAEVARSLVTGAFVEGDAGRSGEPSRTPSAARQAAPTRPLSDSSTPSASLTLPSGTIKGKKATYWQSIASLGVQVAEALDYAHKQGILHRDIKPSNLLLDARGTVWVADFGLARAESEAHLTNTGELVGTLRYLPPEAFEGRMDKRGDIYSLGLTLYELLALQPAFAERDRHRLIKRITIEEPARLDKLDRHIPRDLVTIVHKAIDREPSRRYATAGELAADLQRYLDDEPIRARRMSRAERLARWCRHHPGVAALTAVLLLVFAMSFATVFWAWRRAEGKAEDERRAAGAADLAKQQVEINLQESVRQSRLAEDNFITARKAVDDSFTKISENQLLQVPGMQPLRRELLQSALAFYQDFLKERGDDASIRGELAAAFLRLGKIHKELGEAAKARAAYGQAADLYEALRNTEPASVEWPHGLAQCLFGLDRTEEAIALWEKLIRPNEPRFRKELADAYNERGVGHMRAGRLAEAQQAHREALTLREMLVRLNPDDPVALFSLGVTLNDLGALLAHTERLAEARAMYRRAAEHGQILFERAPQVILHGRLLAIAQFNVGSMERRLGRLPAAAAAFQRAGEVLRHLARDNPAVLELHSLLFRFSLSLVVCQRELNQIEQAERTLRSIRQAIGQIPSDEPGALFLSACLHAQCSTFLARGKTNPSTEERIEQEREARLAIEALGKAVASGFRDLERLRTASEWNALRGRKDFRAVTADLAARVDETLLKTLMAAIERNPEDRAQRWKRAAWYAGHARWKEAAADFRMVLERHPPSDDLPWLYAAPAVAAGDREGYRAICRAMLRRFGATQDPTTADRIAKASLLLPESTPEVKRACDLADLADARGQDHRYALYFSFCKGFADYRRGEFRAAAQRLHPLLPRLVSLEFVAAQAHLVLAMALHRQGDAKAAREHLAQGGKRVADHFAAAEGSEYHHDWTIAWLLHREAQALIEGKKTEPVK